MGAAGLGGAEGMGAAGLGGAGGIGAAGLGGAGAASSRSSHAGRDTVPEAAAEAGAWAVGSGMESSLSLRSASQ